MDNWFPNSHNYGSPLNDRRKVLLMYSPGYSTIEECLSEVDDGELEEYLREQQENEIQRNIF